MNQGYPQKEFEADLLYLKNHPFNLEKMPENIEDNEILSALHAMARQVEKGEAAKKHLVCLLFDDDWLPDRREQLLHKVQK